MGGTRERSRRLKLSISFDATNHVRGWWSEEMEGRTHKLGLSLRSGTKTFTGTQKIAEFIPGKKDGMLWTATVTLSKTEAS
jgi:hypothetical protein